LHPKDIEASDIIIKKGTWLEHLFIDPPNIGKRIGTKLFRHLREKCLSTETWEIGILADPNSKGFYEKRGCTYIREYHPTIKGRTTPYRQYRPKALTSAFTADRANQRQLITAAAKRASR